MAPVMRVDFMIIGAQKCGTSTLFDILDSHPSIVGSRPKETNFFSLSQDWRNDLRGYEGLFELKEGALYFEASTSYTFYPLRNLRIWDDIFDYNPKMKFIYLVRNPIERVVSNYMHAYERGYTDLDIEEAIRTEPVFIDVTRFYTQVSPYIRRFGRSNVLLIDFDDLIQSRQTVLRAISEFLAIDFKKFGDYEKIHSNVSIGGRKKHRKFDNPSLPLRAIRRFLPSAWNRLTDNSKRSFGQRPALTSECKEVIMNMLELEVRALERLMQKDLSGWTALEE